MGGWRRHEDRLSGGLGLSRVPHQLSVRDPDKEKEGRDLYLRSREREWLASLHLDIEATI